MCRNRSERTAYGATRPAAVRAALFAAAWLVISVLHGGTVAAEEEAKKAVEEAAEKAATKAAEKTAEKVQKGAEKAATKAVEKAATRAVEEVVQKAAEAAAAKAELTAVRPDENRGPTEIGFFVFLIDVDAVDDADQNFTANVFLQLEWKDERLANPGGPVRELHLEDVWNPQVLMVNQQGLHARALPEVVEVEPDGTVRYRQRYTGKVSQPLDLSEFPMDRQQFTIQFVSVTKDSDKLKFFPMDVKVHTAIRGGGIANKFSLPDWRILKHEIPVLPYEPVEGVRAPGFAIRFEAKRYIDYYIWQVVFPLAVVVIMSWAAFWIGGSEVSVRMGIATGSILTLVALRFVVANLLPRLPYMTRMDYFTVGSTVLVFLALVLVVLTSFLFETGRDGGVRKVDLVSRAVFPAAFASMLLWFFAG